MTDEAAGKLTAAIIRLADALATTKEGNEKERSPYNPLKEKAREETLSQTPNACVRVRARKVNSSASFAAFNERLVPVFDLVVKNGSDREESVCELAARDRNGKKEAEARYSRNLEKILKFFLGQ